MVCEVIFGDIRCRFGDGTEEVRVHNQSHRKYKVNTNEDAAIRVDRWYYIGKGANIAGLKGVSLENLGHVPFE